MPNIAHPSAPAGTTYAYTTYQDVITVTDPLGEVTDFDYDAMGNVTHVTDPTGREAAFTYDNLNRVLTATQVSGGGNKSTVYTYASGGCGGCGGNGVLSTVTDAGGATTSFVYDDNANLVTLTDALSRPTYFTYDNMNRVITVADPVSSPYVQVKHPPCPLQRGNSGVGGDIHGDGCAQSYDDVYV